jgi:hypothetical protein
MVPRMAALLKPSEGVELGIVGSFDRQVYRTGFPSEQQTLDAQYIRETSRRAGLAANLKFGPSDLWLSSTVGVDFLNDYEILNGQRERIENHPNLAAGPAPFVRLVLGWRPPRRTPVSQPPPEAAPSKPSGLALSLVAPAARVALTETAPPRL